MPTPERSIFTTNVGLGRQFGLMGWGYLFDKRLDYAAGIFNGSRNSFESLNNGVDFVAFLNTRPFQESESLEFARFLNLGTSVALGHQDQSPVPVAFRIGGSSPNADVPGFGTTPFLILNPGVIERGDRLLGSVHTAYFYKGLSLIGEWQYGYGSYASFAHPSSAQVPFSGFYVVGRLLPDRRARRASDHGSFRCGRSSRPAKGTRAVRAPGRSSAASASCAWARRSSPPGSPTRISGPTRPSRRNSA